MGREQYPTYFCCQCWSNTMSRFWYCTFTENNLDINLGSGYADWSILQDPADLLEPEYIVNGEPPSFEKRKKMCHCCQCALKILNTASFHFASLCFSQSYIPLSWTMSTISLIVTVEIGTFILNFTLSVLLGFTLSYTPFSWTTCQLVVLSGQLILGYKYLALFKSALLRFSLLHMWACNFPFWENKQSENLDQN